MAQTTDISFKPETFELIQKITKNVTIEKD